MIKKIFYSAIIRNAEVLNGKNNSHDAEIVDLLAEYDAVFEKVRNGSPVQRTVLCKPAHSSDYTLRPTGHLK